MAGSFHTKIKIGALSLNNLIGDNFSNMYMVCVAPNGSVLWLRGFVGEGNFLLQDIEIDQSGNYYFTGRFYGTTTFGNITVSSSTWDNGDFILGKLSNDFEVQWIKFKNKSQFSLGAYLENTSNGVLVSGVGPGGFQIDDSILPESNNLQAFVAKVLADGTVSWLKAYGDALHPGSYSELPSVFYMKGGFQFSKIADQCYFISGNFVSSLNTKEGPLIAQSRDIFTGIFTETPPVDVDIGPDIIKNICGVDTCTLSLNSILGSNSFLGVEGTMPTMTVIDDSKVKLSNIAIGVTKFKWVVQNCGSVSSKLITLNRASPDGPYVLGSTSFCKSQLDTAIVTVSGINIVWFADEGLTHQIGTGNILSPSVSGILYAKEVVEGCFGQPAKITISIVDNPPPPTGEAVQTLVIGETISDLVVIGSNIKWYSASGDVLPTTTPLENASYMATQTVSGCESPPLTVNVAVVTGVENNNPTLSYYPNPVKDNLIISSDRPINHIVVKNVFGQILISKQVHENTTELRLASLKSGIYFIQVDSTEKIIRILKD
jgi:hypothetical protein